MAARANVPAFGNWENDNNVPYTVYFDKARKNKGGKMINPNDPQENPGMFPDNDLVPPPRPHTRQEEPIERGGVVRPSPRRTTSPEEGEFRQFTNSPARSERSANESNYGGRGQRPNRAIRPSVGSEQSFERSPLHPANKVMASPGYEGRNHDSGHGTGGKSRLRQTNHGDESPDHAAVPRFGAWDEDPQSAENFTHIFNQIREEKNTVPGNVTGTPKHPSHDKSHQSNKTKNCCFPW